MPVDRRDRDVEPQLHLYSRDRLRERDGFLQVTFGYLLGRVLVAAFLLPKYFQGEYETVYEFLQRRFGRASRKTVSVIFHVTRLFADSVRLFATAIPLTVMIGWDYRLSLAVIGTATFIYTFTAAYGPLS